jgi:hypothetical protein
LLLSLVLDHEVPNYLLGRLMDSCVVLLMGGIILTVVVFTSIYKHLPPLLLKFHLIHLAELIQEHLVFYLVKNVSTEKRAVALVLA